VTCVIEEEGHHLAMFLYWATFKCFLLDTVTYGKATLDSKAQNKQALFAFIESMAGLAIAGCKAPWPYALFVALVLLLHMRCNNSELLNPCLAFFSVYYLSCNFCVNLTDFGWRKMYLGIEYYHDEEFTMSFSYRVHQFVLFALLAFISAMLLCPGGAQQD